MNQITKEIPSEKLQPLGNSCVRTADRLAYLDVRQMTYSSKTCAALPFEDCQPHSCKQYRCRHTDIHRQIRTGCTDRHRHMAGRVAQTTNLLRNSRTGGMYVCTYTSTQTQQDGGYRPTQTRQDGWCRHTDIHRQSRTGGTDYKPTQKQQGGWYVCKYLHTNTDTAGRVVQAAQTQQDGWYRQHRHSRTGGTYRHRQSRTGGTDRHRHSRRVSGYGGTMSGTPVGSPPWTVPWAVPWTVPWTVP